MIRLASCVRAFTLAALTLAVGALAAAAQTQTGRQAGPGVAPAGPLSGSVAPRAAAVAQFPEADVFRVLVVGDAMAEGFAPVLADILQFEPRLQVGRRHRAIGSLVRPDWEDDVKALEGSRETAQIVILMTGFNDRQGIRMPGASRALPIGSEDWKDEYARRFDRLLKAVATRNAVVYVIGQPILRNPTQNGHAEVISDVMRQRAGVIGARFIDIYETFQDDSGGFSQFGPDFSGNRVKLREGDGVMLTSLGQRKLALTIEKDLRRDLAQAVSDRSFPLAGDEAEQKRISAARIANAQLAGARGGAAAGGRAGVQSLVPVAPRASDAAGEKADNSRVAVRLVNAAGREETATLEIIRPAIAADVIALLTRRESAGQRVTQPGEAVAEHVGGGLTVLNTVSSLGTTTTSPQGQRVVPASQNPFYRVLIKGERMAPKPGRADDFSWPRTDPFVPPVVDPRAETQAPVSARTPASPARTAPRSTQR